MKLVEMSTDGFKTLFLHLEMCFSEVSLQCRNIIIV